MGSFYLKLTNNNTSSCLDAVKEARSRERQSPGPAVLDSSSQLDVSTVCSARETMLPVLELVPQSTWLLSWSTWLLRSLSWLVTLPVTTRRPGFPAPTMYHPQHQHHPAQHPSPAPHSPHMLHWDQYHPVGQTIPLRQPNPPVYYNVPSPNSSGLQSPGSDGSSMSCSDISEDQEEPTNGHIVHGQHMCYFQPNVNTMMGYPPHLRNYQGPTQYINLNQQGPVFPQQQHGGQNFNQAYISS